VKPYEDMFCCTRCRRYQSRDNLSRYIYEVCNDCLTDRELAGRQKAIRRRDKYRALKSSRAFKKARKS